MQRFPPPTTAALAVGLPAALLYLSLLPGATSAQQAPTPAAEESPDQPPFLASAYLPLDHWAYPLIERWIVAGRVESLSPLVRPYRRMDLARAVSRLREAGVDGVERRWLEALARELRPELARLAQHRASPGSISAGSARRPELSLRISGGGEYRTQTHRDPLRPALDGRFSADRFLERITGTAHGHAGPVAAGVRIRRDRLYLNDAQFPDGRVVREVNLPLVDEAAARVEEAYLELQSRWARIGFGRGYEEWGVPGTDGFLRSDYAYSHDELRYRVGTDRVFLAGALASLSDFPGDTARFFALHRLEARPFDNFAVAVSEASLHGGPGKGLDPTLVNPVSIWVLTRSEESLTPSNLLGQLDLWWRPVRGVALYGSLLADATNTPRTGTTCCSLGGSLGADVLPPGAAVLLRFRASALQSLVYRTVTPWEEYTFERVGLGWDKSDLILVSVEVDWLARGDLRLAPRLDLQVRGEGDFRRPHPPLETLPDFPDLLLGEAETTLRPALAGSWRPPLESLREGIDPTGQASVEIFWDLGWNLIRDYGNRAGDHRFEWVGRAGVSVASPHLTTALP